MNCNAINEQMSEALDGQLDAAPQAAFDGHLAQCPACAAAYAKLQEAVGLLGELEPLTPPTNLIVGINEAIDRSDHVSLRWNVFNTPPMRVALAASVVVVVGVLGIQCLDPAPKDSTVTVAPFQLIF